MPLEASNKKLQSNAAYAESRCQAFVCDISRNPLPEAIPAVDCVTMIFVLSALTPERVPTALATVFRALRPGGVLLFRDYAVNDGAHKKMTNKKGAVLIHYRLRICTRLTSMQHKQSASSVRTFMCVAMARR